MNHKINFNQANLLFPGIKKGDSIVMLNDIDNDTIYFERTEKTKSKLEKEYTNHTFVKFKGFFTVGD